MRRVHTASPLALLLVLAGCVEDAGPDGEGAQPVETVETVETIEREADQADLAFEVFPDDIGGRGKRETRVLLKTSGAYRQYFGHDAPPQVDFGRQWVFFYSAGEKPTQGHEALIDQVRTKQNGKTLYFHTRLSSPAASCAPAGQSIPHVLIAFERPARPPERARAIHRNETAACTTGRHVRKVALVIYDPTNPATGERLSAANGWWGPAELDAHSSELAAAIRTASDGHADFQIVSRAVVDEFPVKRDGFRYTWESYQACRADTNSCHQPDDVAYLPLMQEDTGQDLCAAIGAGTIDEVWVWGYDYSGFDEFAFKIPGDAALFATDPYNYWIYDGRIKDLPECGRTYFVMGWNALVPGGNALHSFGHRAESALTISPPGRGLWGACDGSSEWTDFACVGKDGGGVAGCGNIHYPPNGESDYDYGNPTSVASYCADYANYPAVSKATAPVTSQTWSPAGVDTQWDYLIWWMSHLPRLGGSHVAAGVEVANDWWRYILCYDGPCPLTN